MSEKAPAVLFSLIVAVVAGAAVVLLCEARGDRSTPPAGFQQLVRGLGFGPAADLGRCDFGFDPRLSETCRHDLGPIPGGAVFCPDHACSVFFYWQRRGRSETAGGEGVPGAEVP